MALTAIYNQSYFGKSVTRPAIANYIKSNFKVPEVNVLFNISLRKALAEGVNHGYLDNGETSARFKLNDKGRVYVHEKKLPSKQFSGTKKRSTPKPKSSTKSKSKSKTNTRSSKKKSSSSTKKKSSKTATKKSSRKSSSSKKK